MSAQVGMDIFWVNSLYKNYFQQYLETTVKMAIIFLLILDL